MIDSIKCTDPGVVAALSHIRLDDVVNGMRNNFDAAVTFLLPTDPIRMKQKSGAEKRPIVEIASVEMKQVIGTTGVELRYHVSSEYFQLKYDQKKELKEWRETAAGKAAMAKDQKSKTNKKGKGESNKQLCKTVASILADDKSKASNIDFEVQEIHKYLVSFMSGTSASAALPSKPSTVPPTLPPPVSADVAANQAALQLQGILRRGCNKE